LACADVCIDEGRILLPDAVDKMIHMGGLIHHLFVCRPHSGDVAVVGVKSIHEDRSSTLAIDTPSYRDSFFQESSLATLIHRHGDIISRVGHRGL
jgi:hypothetical protein